MALSHKNADNEYFVHTDPNVVKTDTWSWFGTSKESEESEAELQVKKLQKELAQLKTRVIQLNIHVYFLERNVGEKAKKEITLSKRNAINNLRDENSDDHEMTVQNFRNQVSQNKFDQEDIDIVNALGAAISAGGVRKQ